MTTMTAPMASSRDHGTRPLFIEDAAKSQYSQNAAHTRAKTSSTARIVAQTATVRWPARTVASVAYCVGRHVQIVPSALARDRADTVLKAASDGSSARLGTLSPRPPNALTTWFNKRRVRIPGLCPPGIARTTVDNRRLARSLRAITPLSADGRSVSDHRERRQGLNNVHSMPERADTGISV